jgi:hypothetical protein
MEMSINEGSAKRLTVSIILNASSAVLSDASEIIKMTSESAMTGAMMKLRILFRVFIGKIFPQIAEIL